MAGFVGLKQPSNFRVFILKSTMNYKLMMHSRLKIILHVWNVYVNLPKVLQINCGLMICKYECIILGVEHAVQDPIPKRMIILLGMNCGKRWGTKGIFMALQKSRPVLNTVNFSDRLLLLEHILSQMTVMLFVSLGSFQTSFSMCELLGNDV